MRCNRNEYSNGMFPYGNYAARIKFPWQVESGLADFLAREGILADLCSLCVIVNPTFCHTGLLVCQCCIVLTCSFRKLRRMSESTSCGSYSRSSPESFETFLSRCSLHSLDKNSVVGRVLGVFITCSVLFDDAIFNSRQSSFVKMPMYVYMASWAS